MAQGKGGARLLADLPQIVEKDKRHVFHPMIQHSTLQKKDPLVFVSGRGSTVVDAHGKEYIDAFAGLWCVNVGYGREEVARAAYEQMLALAYFPHIHAHVPGAEFAAQIAALFGGDLKHVYFVNSGSEANEAAFKFARQHGKQAHPGQNRYKIIARYGGYHGTTLSTLAAGGMTDRKVKFEPLDGAFLHAPPPYCYRCPLGLQRESCGLACAKAIEHMIASEGEETVAAVVVEPIMSGLGVVVPPDGYLEMVQEICRRHGVLLLVDEVINGFGRTGAMFGHQHWGLQPDIVAVAKGITSAYLPLAATVVSDRVFNTFLGEPSEMRHVIQVNTYGGHPAACAAGLANLRILREEKLPERAAETGAYLIDELRRALGDHPKVGDIRGKGLLIGVEMVEDRQSKQPLSSAGMDRINAECLARGVIIGRSTYAARGLGNVVTLCPPLVLTRAEAGRIVEVLAEAIRAVG